MVAIVLKPSWEISVHGVDVDEHSPPGQSDRVVHQGFRSGDVRGVEMAGGNLVPIEKGMQNGQLVMTRACVEVRYTGLAGHIAAVRGLGHDSGQLFNCGSPGANI